METRAQKRRRLEQERNDNLDKCPDDDLDDFGIDADELHEIMLNTFDDPVDSLTNINRIMCREEAPRNLLSQLELDIFTFCVIS